VAIALCPARGDVVIASRKIQACEDPGAEMITSSGRRALSCPVPHRWLVASPTLRREAFQRVDVMVNNAGMCPLYQTLSEFEEVLLDMVVPANFKEPIRVSATMGQRIAAGVGVWIVNVSNNAAIAIREKDLVYDRARAALNAMTIGLACAYAPMIRANVIMPRPWEVIKVDGVGSAPSPA
jgi:NAD(P)-dependent dehydrogenase (short-subunit alcohol dehydrogenase family)